MFLCSPDTACHILHCTPADLNNFVLLRPLKLGNTVRYYMEDVEIVAAEFGL